MSIGEGSKGTEFPAAKRDALGELPDHFEGAGHIIFPR